jgi:hypothetical protein
MLDDLDWQGRNRTRSGFTTATAPSVRSWPTIDTTVRIAASRSSIVSPADPTGQHHAGARIDAVLSGSVMSTPGRYADISISRPRLASKPGSERSIWRQTTSSSMTIVTTVGLGLD